MFSFTDKGPVVSHCPKKDMENVLLLSTMHKDALSSREDKKTQMVLDYKEPKGGIDNLDKDTAT